jgi:hypothetical protein
MATRGEREVKNDEYKKKKMKDRFWKEKERERGTTLALLDKFKVSITTYELSVVIEKEARHLKSNAFNRPSNSISVTTMGSSIATDVHIVLINEFKFIRCNEFVSVNNGCEQDFLRSFFNNFLNWSDIFVSFRSFDMKFGYSSHVKDIMWYANNILGPICTPKILLCLLNIFNVMIQVFFYIISIKFKENLRKI